MSQSHDALIMLEPTIENALLVGIYIKGTPREDCEFSLLELGELCKAAFVNPLETWTVPRNAIDKSFLVGSGKLEEIKNHCLKENIKTVIFDEVLTPLQNKNLQNYFQFKVVDRVELILQIFAKRAKSAEAKIQVEMAQLIYLMPRLTRMWAHLSRQFGGVGCKGPGETQLEIDRRRAKEKIFKLKQKLTEIKKGRQTQRKNRIKNELPHVCLVGYTHAGKSTLFNVLTASSDARIRHELFSTLDPLSRKVEVSPKKEIILSDTIGFISKLPHFLVDTFKATLEEVLEADLLLLVMDGSDTRIDQKLEAVNAVLSDLGVTDVQRMMIVNKTDLLNDSQVIALKEKMKEAFFISASEQQNVSLIKSEITSLVFKTRKVRKYFFPFSELDIWKKHSANICVVNESYMPDGLYVEAEVEESQLYRFAPYECAAT